MQLHTHAGIKVKPSLWKGLQMSESLITLRRIQRIRAPKRHGYSYPRHKPTGKLMCNNRIRKILPTRYGTIQHPPKHYGLSSRRTLRDNNDVRLDTLQISSKTNKCVNLYIVSSAVILHKLQVTRTRSQHRKWRTYHLHFHCMTRVTRTGTAFRDNIEYKTQLVHTWVTTSKCWVWMWLRVYLFGT